MIYIESGRAIVGIPPDQIISSGSQYVGRGGTWRTSSLPLDITVLFYIKMCNSVIAAVYSALNPVMVVRGRIRHSEVSGSKIQSRRDDTDSNASNFSLLPSLTLCRRANRWHVRKTCYWLRTNSARVFLGTSQVLKQGFNLKSVWATTYLWSFRASVPLHVWSWKHYGEIRQCKTPV